jgi:hypothetical protein
MGVFMPAGEGCVFAPTSNKGAGLNRSRVGADEKGLSLHRAYDDEPFRVDGTEARACTL